MLSTPLATYVGPGPEGGGGGAQLDREFAFYASRRRLRGRSGVGGAEKRCTGAATSIPNFRNYSDFTGSQPMGRDYETIWTASLGSLGLADPLALLVRQWRAAKLASPSELEGPARVTRTDYLVYCSQRA